MAKDPSNLRILVVDDHVHALSMIKATLAEIGTRKVWTASNGQEAVTYLGLSDNPIDLVICDWKMPKMGGLEVLKFVRSAHPDMPFLMITGLATEEDVKEAMGFGISAYIAKPFTPEQLEDKLFYLAQIIEN